MIEKNGKFAANNCLQLRSDLFAAHLWLILKQDIQSHKRTHVSKAKQDQPRQSTKRKTRRSEQGMPIEEV